MLVLLLLLVPIFTTHTYDIYFRCRFFILTSWYKPPGTYIYIYGLPAPNTNVSVWIELKMLFDTLNRKSQEWIPWKIHTNFRSHNLHILSMLSGYCAIIRFVLSSFFAFFSAVHSMEFQFSVCVYIFALSIRQSTQLGFVFYTWKM